MSTVDDDNITNDKAPAARLSGHASADPQPVGAPSDVSPHVERRTGGDIWASLPFANLPLKPLRAKPLPDDGLPSARLPT